MPDIPVLMNNVERFGLWELATQRQAFKESHGIKSKKIDKEISDLDMHYAGLKAEHAVAKLLGLALNMENTYTGDGGVDLRYRGITIDVKFSSRHLNVNEKKELVADVVVLVNPLTSAMTYEKAHYAAGPDPRISTKPKFAWANSLVVGWISKTEYLSLRTWKKGRYDPYWYVSALNMHDMLTLKEYAISTSRRRGSEEFWDSA